MSWEAWGDPPDPPELPEGCMLEEEVAQLKADLEELAVSLREKGRCDSDDDSFTRGKAHASGWIAEKLRRLIAKHLGEADEQKKETPESPRQG